ncbi:Lrp/AsnC family transcriptional regulator [Paenibacillus aurantiacus]|uniref:Lrp/AsnC family transcriptional regulator n=1 Tax=Paenibacillus aurantiacus TaxID=1936118 RepID=A0ABV5KPG8_9BACL
MDEIDLQILRLLEENGRLTHEEISRLLHISRPTVHQRVSKLEKNGVIRGYRCVVDWRKLEQKIKALIFVKVKCQNYSELAGIVVELQIPGVTLLECQRLAGEWCMLLKVRVSAPEDITRLIDHLVKFPEILETSTTFILSTILENEIKEI